MLAATALGVAGLRWSFSFISFHSSKLAIVVVGVTAWSAAANPVDSSAVAIGAGTVTPFEIDIMACVMALCQPRGLSRGICSVERTAA